MEQVTLATRKGTLIQEAEIFETSVVSGVWRESSAPIEWHNIYEELPRYSGVYNIGHAAIAEFGITMPAEAAARLESFFKWHYISAPDPIPEIDCHRFVDYIAFNKPLFEPGRGFLDTPTDNFQSATPYRLVKEVGKDAWNAPHSFFTTDDPAMTLSIFGIRGVLAAMEINELYKTYETSAFVYAEDSRKKTYDSNVKVFQ